MPIDFLIRWHDVPSRRWRKYLSWLLCAAFFPRVRDYQVFLANSVHFLPVVMRLLGRLRRDQKIVAIVSDETPYFLKARRYSPLAHRALLSALRRYDALICCGRMEAHLVESLLDGRPGPPVFTVRGVGVGRDRREAFSRVRPSLDGRTVLFIGSGPMEWRGWYKGLDLLFDALALAATDLGALRLCVVGDWHPAYLGALTGHLPPSSVTLDLPGGVWQVSRLAHYLSGAALYVHLGRGDAFPNTVIEAMYAGIPCIVSEWTGTREAVEQVDPRLVVPCAAESAAERIRWYFGLPLATKEELSARSREVAAQYTEERAVGSFVEVYRQMLRRFGLPDLPSAAVPEGSVSA